MKNMLVILSEMYTNTISTLSRYISSPLLVNATYSFAVKMWEGTTRFLDPHNVTKLFQAKKTRHSLQASMKANVVCYLSLALAYEMAFQTISQQYLDQDDSLFHASIYWAIYLLPGISLATMTLHRYYDNTAINLALVKQISEENPISPHYKPCGCDHGILITSGLFSSVDLLGKIMSIWIASHVPVIKYVTPLAYAFAYGESLAEYPYSSVGVCTKHRTEEISKHNAYSLGLGVSFYATGEFITYLIYYYMGLNNFFIKNAVYSSIYPWFIISTLVRDREIPGGHQGVDFFYYQRYVLRHMLENALKKIIPLLQESNKSNYWNIINKALTSSPVRIIEKIFSHDPYGDWQTMDKFILNPANQLFFTEYYESLKKIIDGIIDIREKSITERPLRHIPLVIVVPLIPTLPNRITALIMSNESKQFIKIIFGKGIKNSLNNLRAALEYIKNKQEDAAIRVIAHDPKVLQALATASANVQKIKKVAIDQKPIMLPIENNEGKSYCLEQLFSETAPENEQIISQTAFPQRPPSPLVLNQGLFSHTSKKLRNKPSILQSMQLIDDYEPGLRK